MFFTSRKVYGTIRKLKICGILNTPTNVAMLGEVVVRHWSCGGGQGGGGKCVTGETSNVWQS